MRVQKRFMRIDQRSDRAADPSASRAGCTTPSATSAASNSRSVAGRPCRSQESRTVRMLASSSLTISCMNAPRCIERDACRSTAAQSPSTGTSFADAGCISLYPLPTPPTRVTGTAAAAGGIRSLTRPSTSAARSPADFATSAATSPADLAVSCAIVPSRSTERLSCTKILNSSRSSRPEASTSYLRKSCSTDQSGAPSVGGGPACSLAR
mmetsp:Transcript_44093/g.146084  ORF Transcript_44093/g.146084 Transcript_44093/m.146084 type:complete len:210 (+) Transcript_44093:276-905(+)